MKFCSLSALSSHCLKEFEFIRDKEMLPALWTHVYVLKILHVPAQRIEFIFQEASKIGSASIAKASTVGCKASGNKVGS